MDEEYVFLFCFFSVSRNSRTYRSYFVCEKSDGLRCLMYITADENRAETVYLITRSNEYYIIPHMHFPLEDNVADFHAESLIDGELVTYEDSSDKPHYLIFDCLALDRKPQVHRPLDKRLGYLREKLHRPYKKLLVEYPEDTALFPFKVEFKDMQLSYGLPRVFEQMEKLKHHSDGLIFTPTTRPYVYGTDHKL